MHFSNIWHHTKPYAPLRWGHTKLYALFKCDQTERYASFSWDHAKFLSCKIQESPLICQPIKQFSDKFRQELSCITAEVHRKSPNEEFWWEKIECELLGGIIRNHIPHLGVAIQNRIPYLSGTIQNRMPRLGGTMRNSCLAKCMNLH